MAFQQCLLTVMLTFREPEEQALENPKRPPSQTCATSSGTPCRHFFVLSNQFQNCSKHTTHYQVILLRDLYQQTCYPQQECITPEVTNINIRHGRVFAASGFRGLKAPTETSSCQSQGNFVVALGFLTLPSACFVVCGHKQASAKAHATLWFPKAAFSAVKESSFCH